MTRSVYQATWTINN